MNGAELGERARSLIEMTRGAYEPTATRRVQVRWRVESAVSSPPRTSPRSRFRCLIREGAPMR